MSNTTPREIGTLIVVVLKAKNLPNKRHIGKQDPYCAVTLAKETQRTKAVKRGGQHPEWDEEIRFSLVEDTEDILARTSINGDDPPPVPAKTPGKRKFNKNKNMRLACFADDPREPELIGEVVINLAEVLTKGETDEWYSLTSKDKYSGEIYLEMTFWSNERVPAKSQAPRPSVSNSSYGGSGFFKPAPGSPIPEKPLPATSSSDIPPNTVRGRATSSSPRYRTASEILPDSQPLPRQELPVPDALRPSSSLAQLDLYRAPYESGDGYRPPQSQYDEFGASAHRRRESFPPLVDHGQRNSSLSYSHTSTSQSLSHYPPTSGLSDSMSLLSLQPSHSYSSGYSRPLPQVTGGSTISESTQPEYYEPQYDNQYETQNQSNRFSQSLPPTNSFPHVSGGPSYGPPRTSPSPLPALVPGSTGFGSPHTSHPPVPMGYMNPQPGYNRGPTPDPGGFQIPQQSSRIPSSSYPQETHAALNNFSQPPHQNQLSFSTTSQTQSYITAPTQYDNRGDVPYHQQMSTPLPAPPQSYSSYQTAAPTGAYPPGPQSAQQYEQYDGHGQAVFSQQPLTTEPPPLSHSAPPGSQFAPSQTPVPTGYPGAHRPRYSDASSTNRPLPDPQQQLHSYSQPVLSRMVPSQPSSHLVAHQAPPQPSLTPPPPPPPVSFPRAHGSTPPPPPPLPSSNGDQYGRRYSYSSIPPPPLLPQAPAMITGRPSAVEVPPFGAAGNGQPYVQQGLPIPPPPPPPIHSNQGQW